MVGDDEAKPYPHPKILAIDYAGACASAIRSAGYSVQEGSFGRPYPIEPHDGYSNVDYSTARLGGHTEAEIVFINTAMLDATADRPTPPGPGVDAIWMSCKSGRTDPKPLVMHQVSGALDRVYENGGVFIVSLAAQYQATYHQGVSYGRDRVQDTISPAKLTNWGFLSCMSDVVSKRTFGEEIYFSDISINNILSEGAVGATYNCTLATVPRRRGALKPLAHNKYGQVVAGYMESEKGG
ncbi:hypothetical protein [Plesiocystis pacifica]|uniref:hypothetical protein n=1 Tax=Plesiocystis pacifica TaxID=191768 RepID=UPI0012F84D55|nr:hypothetical protein [Plesiocystis pacifica]